MKYYLLVMSLFIVVLSSQGQAKRKILIVSTNVGRLQNADNGTFLMEIAYPFKVFLDEGFTVDVVTPNGGKAAIYHRGEMNDDLRRISQSDKFITASAKTLSPDKVNPMEYAGIYFPGGGGQFYDVFNNKLIAAIAGRIYEQGGVLGAAGHGPASLINIRLMDSTYLVNQKRLTCFPKAYSAKWLPFDWEAVLKQRGADVILPISPDEKEKGVQLIDEGNRIITGSYAENAQWVAEQMTAMIKKSDTDVKKNGR